MALGGTGSANALSAKIFEALFPHVAGIWEQILSHFKNRQFTYDDLRSIGIWPEEASSALYYLSEQWHRIEVTGLKRFRVCSAEPLQEFCPPGAQLGGMPAARIIDISFRVNSRYKGNLQGAARDFVQAAIPAFGSLLDTRRKGGPVDVTVYPTDDVVQVLFFTVQAPLTETDGFEKYARLQSNSFGTLV